MEDPSQEAGKRRIMVKIHLVSDGTFKLDGGAMHGVVPRAFWEKQNAPDEKNRILLGLNCLLVETEKEKVLIDSGIGTGHSEKFANTFCINKSRSLIQQLEQLGLAPTDITTVIPTHLHFDHAGGLVNWSSGDLLFPNARVVIQKKEWEAAASPHPKNQASYLPEFLEPLKKAKLELVEGEQEIAPGVLVFLTGGHTHGHQAVFIKSERMTVYPGDLVPTAAHVNPLWTMAYDVEPEKSISMKKILLSRGAKEEWTFVLVHEPQKPVGKVLLEQERYVYRSAEGLFSGLWDENPPVTLTNRS